MSYIDEARNDLQEIMNRMRNGFMASMEKGHKGEMFVLNVLKDAGSKQVTPTEITKKTTLSTPRVSAILSTLEKKEEIIRMQDENNRRRTFVLITSKGELRLLLFQKAMQEKMHFVFTQMGEEKTREFVRLTGEFVNYQEEYNKMKESEKNK